MTISTKFPKTISLAICMAMVCCQASADVVVDLEFDSSGADTEVGVNRTADVSNANELTFNWNAATPFFNGDAAESQIVYGAYSATGNGVVGAMSAGIEDNAGSGTDWMNLQNDRAAGGAMRGRTMMIWDSANFLNSGFNQFDGSADSFISINVGPWNTPDPEAVKFVVRNGSDFFLSNLSSTSTGTFSVAGDTAGLEWAQIDPTLFASYSAGGGDIGLGGSALTYSAQTFDNVTGVGFLTEMERGGGGNMFFNVTDFQAGLTAVPEPSGVIVSLLALSTLAFSRRRSSK